MNDSSNNDVKFNENNNETNVNNSNNVQLFNEMSSVPNDFISTTDTNNAQSFNEMSSVPNDFINATPVINNITNTVSNDFNNIEPDNMSIELEEVNNGIDKNVVNADAEVELQNTQFNNNVVENSIPDNDEELLKSFIGKNYDKITTKKFSFSGFFFSFGYMFYRKMFLYGIVFALIETALVSFIADTTVASISVLIISILCGLIVNKLYIGFATSKIRKFKSINVNQEQLNTLCAIKGGTSVGKVVLGILVEIIFAIVIAVVAIIIGFKSSLTKIVSDFAAKFNISINGSETNNTNKDIKYSGEIEKDTSIIIKDKFSISLPSYFENNSLSYDYKYVYKTGNGDFDECSIEMYSPKKFTDAEKLIQEMAEYDSESIDKIEKETINEIEWNKYYHKNGFGEKIYYGATIDEKVYLVELKIEEDSGMVCGYYLADAMETIAKKSL